MSEELHRPEMNGAVQAVVLTGPELTANDRNTAALLEEFGIPCRRAVDKRRPYCVITSAMILASLLETQQGPTRALLSEACSVYIYGFRETPECLALLRLLTGDPQACIRNSGRPHTRARVTSEFPEMCGPMAGLEIAEVTAGDGKVFSASAQTQPIISLEDGPLFCTTTWQGARLFLSGSEGIIDIHSRSEQRFDVKRHFCAAVPVTLYLKYAFREVLPAAPEVNGCLVVDDPPLKPRYGFLEFHRALELMDRCNFTTTIAFIPWNWKRTSRRTAALFEERRDRLSLAVHGCDHTGGEFATRSTAVLNRKLKTARRRMAGLSRRTSLGHDLVMIFPQGGFSPEAGRALKFNGFVAATNTEVTPSSDMENTPEIAELWRVALTRYGGFPIFTRRYLTDGVENFAFDALLGKPCLIVAHHDVFRGTALAEFIARLNSLNWNLRWRSLGDAIRHSYLIERCHGKVRIRMYGESIAVENPTAEPAEVLVTKDEEDQGSIEGVTFNDSPLAWFHQDGELRAKVTLPPGGAAEIRVRYVDQFGSSTGKDSAVYQLKVMVRRYLSEFRDNYLSQNDFLHDGVRRITRVLFKRPGPSTATELV